MSPEMECPKCGRQVTVNLTTRREYGHHRSVGDGKATCPCRGEYVNPTDDRTPWVSR